jgi:hypothetical protein
MSFWVSNFDKLILFVTILALVAFLHHLGHLQSPADLELMSWTKDTLKMLLGALLALITANRSFRASDAPNDRGAKTDKKPDAGA